MAFELISSFVRLYPEVFGADLLRYVLGAGGVYLVINLGLAVRLRARKIRNAAPVDGQILREILASLRTVAIFATVGTGIGLCSRAGIMTIYPDVEDYGWVYFVASIALLIIAHDAWFYWTHRVLHFRPLFRRFHGLHHRSHVPTPFTAYSFDVGEAVVNALFLPLILLVLPAHPVALLVFVTHMILRNALGHCGIEVFPARADGRPLVGWLTSVTHHDLHHANARWNMGLYFTWWDRWMGTEHPDYHQRFARVARRVPSAKPGVVILCLVALVGLAAGQARAFDLRGSYATPGLGAIIAFEPCEGDHVCARLAWVWDAKDVSHAKVGDTLAASLTFDGSAWTGRMMNPENGRNFKGTLRAKSGGRLDVRGCAGPICIRQTWYSVATLKRVLASVP